MRFRAYSFLFFSFSHILSRQILSVRSFSLSFSLLLLLLSPDDDHLSVLRCCVLRNVGCRRLFAVSEKRKRIYGWWFSSSLKRKERDELRRRSHSRNPIEEPTHSEVILTSSLSLLTFFLKQQTGCPRRLGGDEIGQSLGLSPVCPDDSNTHRRFISRVSKVGRRHRQSRETTHVRGNRKRAIRVSTVGKWNHVFTVSHE